MTGPSTQGHAVRDVVQVVAWVCVRDNAMLHARSRGQSKFYAPGGKIEVGEDEVSALIREVSEELSVALDRTSVELLTVVEAPGHGNAAGRTVRMACFTAEPTGSSAPPRASAEIAEIAWLGLSDRDRCAPADQILLEFLSARGALT